MALQKDEYRSSIRLELDWKDVDAESREHLAARLDEYLRAKGLRLKYLCPTYNCGEVILKKVGFQEVEDTVGSLLDSTDFSPLRITPVVTLRPVDLQYLEQARQGWLAPRFWSQDRLNRNAWHAAGYRGEGVLVAIVDSGIDPKMEQLQPSLAKYRSLVAGGAELNMGYPKHKPTDRGGHGTALACQIAGRTHGMAPACQVLPIKAVFDNRSNACWLACGIHKAVELGAEIIVTTITYPAKESAVIKALELAEDKETIAICAAGNDGQQSSFWPGIHQNTFCVGSINALGEESAFNSSLNQIDLLAPGEDIETCELSGECPVRVSGTSFAAGIAAGAIALLCQKHKAGTGRRLGRQGLQALISKMPVLSGRRVLQI